MKCAAGSWLCRSGGCVPKNRLCDKHLDCSDGSDEDEEFCHSFICGSDKFRCPTGECIFKSMVRQYLSHFSVQKFTFLRYVMVCQIVRINTMKRIVRI